MRCRCDFVELRKAMVDAGFDTNSKLATASDVNRNTIGKILSGKEQPSAPVMYKLTETLNLSSERAGRIFFNHNLRKT